MTVTLDKSHELKGNGYLLGVGGENESEQLIINIAYDVLLDKWAYIEFEQNGKKNTTERLTIANGQIVYSIPNGLLVTGHTSVQVIFRDANGFVWKSFKRQFLVSDEINATENYPQSYPDFISEAQKMLDGITDQSERVEAYLGSDAETARVAAEEQRQINEAGRVDAETARRTEFSGWAVNFGNLNTYDKRLINLEEAGVGTLFDYVTDDTTAYIKTVPAKALPYARLVKVGGMTYKADNALIDAPVKSVGGYAIPEAIQLLDGYGLGINGICHNYIDLGRKVFVQKAKKITFNGSEKGWYFYANSNGGGYLFSLDVEGLKATKDNYTKACYLLGGNQVYVETTANYLWNNNELNNWCVNQKSAFQIRVNISNIESFKAWLASNPITLVFELEEPIETDISAYITDNYIKVNGSIVFENDAAAAVPSEIIYAVKR